MFVSLVAFLTMVTIITVLRLTRIVGMLQRMLSMTIMTVVLMVPNWPMVSKDWVAMIKHKIRLGVVQAYVTGFSTSPFIQHFGLPQYDRNLPILPDYVRERVDPIVANLNAGRITEDEARKLLKRV